MTRLSKRPSFHLDVDSDEEQERNKANTTSSTATATSLPVPLTPESYCHSDDEILKFCSESLYSFSYTYDCNNATAGRLSVLRRSLRMIRDNSAMMKELQDAICVPRVASLLDLHNSLGNSLNNFSSTNQLGNLRPSASSATLSLLGNSSESQLAEDLNSLLNVLEEVGLPDSSSHGYAYPVLSSANVSNTNLINLEQQLENDPAVKKSTTSLIQLQLLEALSVPYVDITPGITAQRAHLGTNVVPLGRVAPPTPPRAPSSSHSSHSSASVPPSSSSVACSVSSVNLAPLTVPSGVVKGTAFNVTPLRPISSKYSTGHAVFTSSGAKPFGVLSLNDMACLIFGRAQHEMRHQSILSLFPENIRSKICDMLSQLADNDDQVVFAGHVLPVLKCNGSQSRASIWAKRKGPRFISWVVQEVMCDKAVVELTPDGTVLASSGHNNLTTMIGEYFKDSSLVNIRQFVPNIPENLSVLYQDPAVYRQYGVHSKDRSLTMPCFASVMDANDSKITLELSSLPHISGAIIIDQRQLNIVDYNSCVIFSLLGYEGSENVRGQSIACIIPNFLHYFSEIKRICNFSSLSLSAGLVIPEQMFRRVSRVEPVNSHAIFSSPSVEARTKYGATIYVDIQMRVVSSHFYALWISYSRYIQGSHDEFEVPSQLGLLQFKKSNITLASVFSSDHARTSSSGTETISPSDSDDNLRQRFSRGSSAATSSPTLGTPDEPDKEHLAKTIASPIEETVPIEGRIVSPSAIGARRREKTLKDFAVLQTIGEGAYGKVLLAQYRTHPKAVVIIKSVIKERILVDTWVRDRKLGTIPNEIKVMAALNEYPHDNIIRMMDFFEDDQYFHIEMERHGNPGTDLFDLIELKPNMPESECKSIFRQVVSAVAHLHSKGIVHRDIKDENIIVDNEGKIKLIDYGSAAFVRQGPFDVFVGTIDYAAPEVLGGHPYEGRPQDIWALGILLYTIIYKENPFYNVDEIVEGELRVPYVTSEGCIDLIRQILTRDLRSRPTIQDIVDNEWLFRDY